MPPRPRQNHPLDSSFCNVNLFSGGPCFQLSLSMVLAIMTWVSSLVSCTVLVVRG